MSRLFTENELAMLKSRIDTTDTGKFELAAVFHPSAAERVKSRRSEKQSWRERQPKNLTEQEAILREAELDVKASQQDPKTLALTLLSNQIKHDNEEIIAAAQVVSPELEQASQSLHDYAVDNKVEEESDPDVLEAARILMSMRSRAQKQDDMDEAETLLQLSYRMPPVKQWKVGKQDSDDDSTISYPPSLSGSPEINARGKIQPPAAGRRSMDPLQVPLRNSSSPRRWIPYGPVQVLLNKSRKAEKGRKVHKRRKVSIMGTDSLR